MLAPVKGYRYRVIAAYCIPLPEQCLSLIGAISSETISMEPSVLPEDWERVRLQPIGIALLVLSEDLGWFAIMGTMAKSLNRVRNTMMNSTVK
jgi:hypothetical protein